MKAHYGERPDLIKHIVDADAIGKGLQLLLVDIAVPRYHCTAFFRTLDEQLPRARMWEKKGKKLGIQVGK